LEINKGKQSNNICMNSRRKWSWFIEATMFKSKIDESVMCVISDVSVAVEIYTMAK